VWAVIALRERLQRQRRKSLVLGAVVLLAATIVLSHGAPAEHEMPGDQMQAAISICLAVLGGGVFLLAGAALARHQRRRAVSANPVPSAGFIRPSPRPTPIRARAGPDLLQVFRR
jgi:putative copper export protein